MVALDTIDQSLNKCLTIQTWPEITDAFHSTRIPVWNFGNSTCPVERHIPVVQTRPTARLVIVLVSRIQKSGTRNNNFVKWKGTFRSDRPKLPDRSCYTASLYLDWSYNPKGNIALVGRTQSLVFNMVFSGWRVRLWLFRDKLLQKEKNVRLANSFLGTRDNTDPLLVIAPRHHEPTLWGRVFLQRSDSQMINIRRKSSLHQNKGQRINDHAASRFAASRPSSEA